MFARTDGRMVDVWFCKRSHIRVLQNLSFTNAISLAVEQYNQNTVITKKKKKKNNFR